MLTSRDLFGMWALLCACLFAGVLLANALLHIL
jgi:hypothetical protein